MPFWTSIKIPFHERSKGQEKKEVQGEILWLQRQVIGKSSDAYEHYGQQNDDYLTVLVNLVGMGVEKSLYSSLSLFFRNR